MLVGRLRKRIAAAAATVGMAVALALVGAAPAQAACADVHIVFARGTNEAVGFGTVGNAFVKALKVELSGKAVTSYAVRYQANQLQTSAGPGATDMTNRIIAVAATCPSTRFVIGGYSQGASVTDIAIGIPIGRTTGKVIPANLASRVSAVVVFGNPLGRQGRTIATASATYGPKSRDYCNDGDPVCNRFGYKRWAHEAWVYVNNGSTTRGAQFAAARIG